jgi:transposase
MEPVRIGLDIAKNLFQVHGVAADGTVVLRRQLRRGQISEFFSQLPPCLVGIEACPSAHHWARHLQKLGHQVRLMPPQYVKPYVKRQKNDAADAEAICEAVDRPTMRFVPVKTEEQQSALILHRTRELLIRQKVMLTNALRSQLAEFGVVAAQGRTGLADLMKLVSGSATLSLPDLARSSMMLLIEQVKELMKRISLVEAEILRWHKANDVSRRLETIPGVGPITASAIAASVADAGQFGNGRQFAAWLGIVPRQNSSGGKERLGRITKWGDSYIRKLLVVSSCALIRYARGKAPGASWLTGVLARRPAKVAAVAMANKTARIIWAVLRDGRTFQKEVSSTAAA